jgi:hypothetical protein
VALVSCRPDFDGLAFASNSSASLVVDKPKAAEPLCSADVAGYPDVPAGLPLDVGDCGGRFDVTDGNN